MDPWDMKMLETIKMGIASGWTRARFMKWANASRTMQSLRPDKRPALRDRVRKLIDIAERELEEGK